MNQERYFFKTHWLTLAGLFIAWISVLVAAAYSWAVHSSTYELVVASRADKVWARPLLTVHLLLLLVVIALPIVAILSRKLAGGSRLFQSAAQRDEVYILAALGFALAQLMYFLQSPRLQASAHLLAVLAVVLAALWLLTTDGEGAARIAIYSLVWGLTLVSTRQVLTKLISIPDDPMWIMLARGVFGLLLLCLSLLPLLGLWRSPSRYISRAETSLVRSPYPLLGLVAGVIGLRVAIELGYSDSLQAWTDFRLGVLALAAVGSMYLVAVFTSKPRAELSSAMDVHPWIYRTLLVAIFLGIFLVSARIVLSPQGATNPDGLVYLTMARAYADGYFPIRGYWSPLLPWLIVPGVAFGADPLTSQRVLSGATVVAWVILALVLSRRLNLPRSSQLAVALAIGAIGLQHAFHPMVPDLLGAIPLLAYFILVSSGRISRHPVRYGILCGILGGLAYYGKHYNLPFFLIHYPLTLALIWLQSRRTRPLLLAGAVGMVTLAVITLPWIAAISLRYEKPMIASSPGINRALNGPKVSRHPCWTLIPCPEPDDVLFPWEDPLPQYYSNFGWSALQSADSLRLQFIRLGEGIRFWPDEILTHWGPLLPMALLGSMIVLLVRRYPPSAQWLLIWTVATVVLYASGYMVMRSAPYRYHLPYIPLLVIATIYFLGSLWGRLVHHWRDRSMLATALATAIFIIVPALSMISIEYYRGILAPYGAANCVLTGAPSLADHLVAPFAGNADWVNYAAYYTKTRTIGVLPEDTDPAHAHRLLSESGAATYVVPADSALGQALRADYSYDAVADASLCGIDYWILTVPVEGSPAPTG